MTLSTKSSFKKIVGGILLLAVIGVTFQPTQTHAQSLSTAAALGSAALGPVGVATTLAANAAYNYASGNSPTAESCIETRGPIIVGVNIQFCAAEGSNLLLQLSSDVLWIVALLFNYTLDYTLNFNKILSDLPIVDIGWSIFRDIANIFFIFVLLFIAINIILDNDKFGGKKLLSTVIVTALLLNFSLFFTKALVDVSNITSLAFYSQMNGSSGTNANGEADGIAASLMRGLGLQTVFSSDLNNTTTSIGATTGNDSDATLSASNAKILGPSAGSLDTGTIIVIGLAGTVLILVTSFVLLAAIALFMIRTVVLLLLMILSPLAFVAQAIPGADQYGKMWWNNLFKQCLFAPIYMAMMYVVVSVVSNPQKYAAPNQSGVQDQGSFVALFAGNGHAISAVFSFGLLISLMVAVLVVASKIGAVGAGSALAAGRGIRSGISGLGKYGASRVIGGTAYKIANSEGWKNSALGQTRFATNIMKGIGKAGFGGKSYEDMMKANEKKEKTHQEYLSTAKKLSMQPGESAKQFADRQKAADKFAKTRVDTYSGVTRDEKGNITAMKEKRWSDVLNAGGRIAFKKTQAEFVKPDLKKQASKDKVNEELAKAQAIVAAGEATSEHIDATQKVQEAKDLHDNKDNHPDLLAAQEKIAKAQQHLKDLREHADIKAAETEVASAAAAANAPDLNEFQKYLTTANLSKANDKLKTVQEKMGGEIKIAEEDVAKAENDFKETHKKLDNTLLENVTHAEKNLQTIEENTIVENTSMKKAREKIKTTADELEKIEKGDPTADALAKIAKKLDSDDGGGGGDKKDTKK